MSTKNTRGVRAHWPAYEITPLGIALAEASKFKRANAVQPPRPLRLSKRQKRALASMADASCNRG